jgi:SAM-dependent methyltransferase
VESAFAGGDPSSIKQVYVSLGSLLEEAVGDDLGDVPLLSLPETAPVVASLLSDVTGPVLDAGCGPMPGLSLELVGRDPARRIVAMDIGLGIVRLACRTASARGVSLIGVVGDLERLPFRDDAFAGEVCDDTIEHVPADATAVAELARCLKPRAPLVMATPNRRSAEVVVHKVRDRLARRRRESSDYFAAASHLREYTWRSLDELLAPYFTVQKRAAVGWPGSGRRRVATILTGVGPLRAWSRMLVVRVTPTAGF